MTRAASPWPPALAGTPSTAVIERAIERDRLSHSLLLHGDDSDLLAGVAIAIADRLLNPPGAAVAYPPERHPDCFELRPAGKMRIIHVEAVRGLMAQLQMTSAVAGRKVAILHEADRMNVQSANLFLKTLEEPPAHSMILMLSTRPYALLPTIRSRTLHFRFPGTSGAPTAAGWDTWIADYGAWLARLSSGVSGKKEAAEALFGAYGLTARFAPLIEKGAEAAWALQKATLPVGMDEDEKEALEVGQARSLRARLFAEIERATRDFAIGKIAAGDAAAGRAFTASIDALEHVSGLLAANLNESAALEDFLLASLRFWTQR